MITISQKNSHIKKKTKKTKTRKKLCTKKKKFITLKNVIKKIKKSISQYKPKNIDRALLAAYKTAIKLKNKRIKPGRIIPIPKVGGILPLIPIFAGLSALGALSGGAAGIAKAVNDSRSARQELEEHKRHNKTMESIALGKGLYLKPYKTGLGVFFFKKASNKVTKSSLN